MHLFRPMLPLLNLVAVSVRAEPTAFRHPSPFLSFAAIVLSVALMVISAFVPRMETDKVLIR